METRLLNGDGAEWIKRSITDETVPQLGVNELAGSVDRYKDFFAALEKTSPVPVGFEAIKTGAKGYYEQMEKRIAINEGMSELQNLKTLIHEIVHSRLHDIDKKAPKDTPRPDRRTREVEAESIDYTPPTTGTRQ